jgi:hypothetical protein
MQVNSSVLMCMVPVPFGPQVEHMEAEIAQKREELEKLQAEQAALRSHQHALESTMSHQDQLLAQLLQVCTLPLCWIPRGAHPPPAGHTQLSRVTLTAGDQTPSPLFCPCFLSYTIAGL